MKYTVLLVLGLWAYHAASQDNVDSLRQVLRQQKTEQRYATLQALCHLYTRPSLPPDEARAYAQELIAAAAARRDTATWVEGYITLALKEKPTQDAPLGQYLPRARQLAKRNPEWMAKVLFWESEALFSIGKEDEALRTIQAALQLHTRHRLHPEYHVKLLGGAARIYSSRNDARSTDSLNRSVLTHARSAADSMEAFRGIAVGEENLGRLDKALDAYLNSYRMAHSIGNTMFAATNLRQAASILRDQRQYDKALQYYEEAAALAEKINLVSLLASTYHSIGVLHKRMGNYTEAIRYGHLALGIKQEMGRPKKVLTTACMMAESYWATAQYAELKAVCLEYLPLSESINMHEVTAKMGYLAAIAFAKTGRAAEGRNWLARANQATEQVKNQEEWATLFEMAASAHAELGQYEGAYRYQLKHQMVKDSVYDMEKNRLVLEMQADFDSERQTERIRDLNRENELAQAQLATARTQQVALGVGLALAGLLAFFLYRNVAIRQQHNQTLTRTNADLERKNADIQMLLREVHHRVKNNLQLVSSLLRLQARKVDDPASRDVLRTSQARIQAMSTLHEQLYQGDIVRRVDIRHYLDQLCQTLARTYATNDVPVDLRLAIEPTEMDIDTAIPIGLITNELITNSFKYAFPQQANRQIDVQLKTDATHFHFTVADNGQGLALEGGSPAPTQHGFGLELVASLVEKINGIIQYTPSGGTRIAISAPLPTLHTTTP